VRAGVRLDTVREDGGLGTIDDAVFESLFVWRLRWPVIGGLAFFYFTRIFRTKSDNGIQLVED